LNAGSTVFAYDADGNPTSITNGSLQTQISYDYEDRPIALVLPGGQTAANVFNGLGARVEKLNSSGTTIYLRDGAEPDSPMIQDTGATYLPGISEVRGSASGFYSFDATASLSQITNNTGAVTDRRLWTAFGEVLGSSGSNPTPYGFLGQLGAETDSDTGFVLFNGRFYAPTIGRFLSRSSVDGTYTEGLPARTFRSGARLSFR